MKKKPKVVLTWIAERVVVLGELHATATYRITVFDATGDGDGATVLERTVRAETDGELQCKADILVIEAGER